MYIPAQYNWKNSKEILSFIKQYNFGVLVNESLKAVHIPFIMEENNGIIELYSHIAKANTVFDENHNKNVLVIFNGPHAYISPTLYESKQNVPTWDYLAVHIKGNVEVIEGYLDSVEILEKVIRFHEPEYMDQWQSLSDDYKKAMVEHIIPFKVEVKQIEATKKLSQNKTTTEIENIKASLLQSGDTVKIELANFMNMLVK